MYEFWARTSAPHPRASLRRSPATGSGFSGSIHGELAVRAIRVPVGRGIRVAVRAAQQSREFRDWDRGAEAITLILITAQRLEEVTLLGCFDALSDDLQL